MRRMPTTKELKYVDELSQVAEKGFQNGVYPAWLNSKGYFNADESISIMEENAELDFENHTIAAGAYLYFYYPELLIHYGLGDDGDVGYIALATDGDITFSENINDEDALKQWMSTQNFLNIVLESDSYVDDVILSNGVALYGSNDNWTLSLQNGQLIMTENLKCTQGQGLEIEGASDPVGNEALESEFSKTENLYLGGAHFTSPGAKPIVIFNDDGILNVENNDGLFVQKRIMTPSIETTVIEDESYTNKIELNDGNDCLSVTADSLYMQTGNGVDIESTGDIVLKNSTTATNITLDETGYLTINSNGLTIDPDYAGSDLALNVCSGILQVSYLGIRSTINPSDNQQIILSGLPTSDPGVEGVLWDDNGVLKISHPAP